MPAASNDTPVWFITGCSTGFGRELASAVIDKGWRAVVSARNPDSVADLVARAQGRAIAMRLDVTRADEIKRAIDDAHAAFGRIDVLVNNAGLGYLSAV